MDFASVCSHSCRKQGRVPLLYTPTITSSFYLWEQLSWQVRHSSLEISISLMIRNWSTFFCWPFVCLTLWTVHLGPWHTHFLTLTFFFLAIELLELLLRYFGHNPYQVYGINTFFPPKDHLYTLLFPLMDRSFLVPCSFFCPIYFACIYFRG